MVSTSIDRYVLEWLAFERDHWAPHPSERKLDEAIAGTGDMNTATAILCLVSAITAQDEAEYPWVERIAREAIAAKDSLLEGAMIGTSNESEAIAASDPVCTVSTQDNPAMSNTRWRLVH